MQSKTEGESGNTQTGAATPPMLLNRWRVPFFYGWVVVGVVFLTEFTSSGLGGTTVTLFFKPMKESLGWSLSQLVGAVTAQAIVGIVVSPFIGTLLDRVGVKPVMLAGTVAAGAGLLSLMHVQEVWQFWMLYAVVGALGLTEMGRLTGPVAVAKWFVQSRGRAMALGTIGEPIGGTVMAPVIGFLIAAVGWRPTWGLMGLVLLAIVVPVVLLFMRSRPEDMGLLPDGERPNPEAVGAGKAAVAVRSLEPSWTLRQALATRTLWLLVIATNLVNLGSGAVQVNLAPFLTEQGGMSTSQVSLVLSAFYGAAICARLIWGFLVERIPVRLCLAILFVFRALGSLSLVLVPYPFNVGSYILLFALLGGAMGLLSPMIFANYYGRAFYGSLSGFLRPLQAIPQLVGPLFIAFLFDATGTFNLAFLIAAAVTMPAVAIVLFAIPPVHSTSTQPATGV